jgi:hypothetical protein
MPFPINIEKIKKDGIYPQETVHPAFTKKIILLKKTINKRNAI